jgi:hypothetical protein
MDYDKYIYYKITVIGIVVIAAMFLIGAYSGNYVRQEGIYAGIHVHGNATPQSIATGAAYTKATAFADNGLSRNATPDVANDKITITIPGRYRISGQTSFSSGTANVVWFGSVFWNGVEQDQVHWSRKTSSSGDVGSASFNGFIEVTSVPTDVDFRVRHDNAGSINITVSYGTLTVKYLGDN